MAATQADERAGKISKLAAERGLLEAQVGGWTPPRPLNPEPYPGGDSVALGFRVTGFGGLGVALPTAASDS